MKIFWKGTVSVDSPKTLRKLCLSTKFPHQEILSAKYGRIKVLSFMRLIGISPPSALFQDKIINDVFKEFFRIQFKCNFLMESFCFNLIILARVKLKFVNNYVNFIKNVKYWLIWPFQSVKVFSDWLEIIIK